MASQSSNKYAAQQKEYRNRPDIKAHIKKYSKEYWQRPEVQARNKTPERQRVILDYTYKRRYGISLKEYELLFEQQGGVCALCKRPPKKYRLDVDHCHETDTIRGLLCNTCNRLVIGIIERLRIPLERLNQYLHLGGVPIIQ